MCNLYQFSSYYTRGKNYGAGNIHENEEENNRPMGHASNAMWKAGSRLILL